MPKPQITSFDTALHIMLYVLGCSAGTLFLALAYLESLLP